MFAELRRALDDAQAIVEHSACRLDAIEDTYRGPRILRRVLGRFFRRRYCSGCALGASIEALRLDLDEFEEGRG